MGSIVYCSSEDDPLTIIADFPLNWRMEVKSEIHPINSFFRKLLNLRMYGGKSISYCNFVSLITTFPKDKLPCFIFEENN